jgi:hypothetical protein
MVQPYPSGDGAERLQHQPRGAHVRKRIYNAQNYANVKIWEAELMETDSDNGLDEDSDDGDNEFFLTDKHVTD